MMDFPASPANGALFTPAPGGPTYVYSNGVWLQSSTPLATRTARRGNRVVNSDMAISQENGSNSVPSASFPVDQWTIYGAGVTVAAAQGGVTSPEGTRTVVMHSFNPAKPSLAAGDYGQLLQRIEGVEISDFNWGTTNAKPAVLRFAAATDTPGLYVASVMNQANDRTYVKGFNATTTMQTFVVPIPAKTDGTWPTGTSEAMSVRFSACAGTTYQAPAEGWNNGAFFGLTGMGNIAATASKNLYITDVGLYIDPDNTGLPPPWEHPIVPAELDRCMRYYEVSRLALLVTNTNLNQRSWHVQKRTTPAVSLVNINVGSGATINPTSAGGWYQSNAHSQAAQADVVGNARM
jgi:hypothetical protein